MTEGGRVFRPYLVGFLDLSLMRYMVSLAELKLFLGYVGGTVKY